MTEPTDDFAFALGLVDRPGVPPAVARELAASVAAYAREFAAEELRKAAEDWDDLSVTGEYAADEAGSFLRRRADALTTGDPA